MTQKYCKVCGKKYRHADIEHNIRICSVNCHNKYELIRMFKTRDLGDNYETVNNSVERLLSSNIIVKYGLFREE